MNLYVLFHYLRMNNTTTTETKSKKIEEAAKLHDSFYLYDEAGIITQTTTLKEAFPSVKFLYSVKCNPNSHVLKTIFGQGFGADAASVNEVLMSEEAGLTKDEIYFSAPGKTQTDIEKIIDKAIIIADSLNEIERIEAVAVKRDIKINTGVRVNPNFQFYESGSHDIGCPSKFGIDEEQLLSYLHNYHSQNVQITGIHVHMRSQELDALVMKRYYTKVIAMADTIQKECGIKLEYINLGSGIGISYSDQDSPLNLSDLGAMAEHEIQVFKEKYPNVRFMIETGRYVVCQNGVYVTKVLDRKISYGKTFIIVKNTLNGFIRPSLERLIAHYTGGKPTFSSEPLFTRFNVFKISALKEKRECEVVTVVGNLCTATDVIAEDIELPKLECGDVITVSNAGSYGAVLSPMQFSSQDKPVELFLNNKGIIEY